MKHSRHRIITTLSTVVCVALGAVGTTYPSHALTREQAISVYNSLFNAPADATPRWTGDVSVGNAGQIAPEWRARVLNRINFYRTMAGISPITTLNDSYNEKCQQAAMVMSANLRLSHTLDASFNFNSPAATEAAFRSNLSLGAAGPAAIDMYMRDDGVLSLGHRRWILYPPITTTGIGDIPMTEKNYSANCLWVVSTINQNPAAQPAYVAWPAPGYVMRAVTPTVWSVSVPNGNVAKATVSIKKGRANVPVQVILKDNSLMGAPTIAFQAPGGAQIGTGVGEETFKVTVRSVKVGRATRTFNYTTTLF